MIKKILNYLSGKALLSGNLQNTNSSFSQEIKEESAYVEQEHATEWLTAEEAKKLKIRIGQEGIDLEDMFKDVKVFSSGDSFNKNSSDFEQGQVDKYEVAFLKSKNLKEKITSGKALSDNNSFRRVKEEK